MKLVLARVPVIAIQIQRYFPVVVMVVSILGIFLGLHPLDDEGGTGH